MAALFIPRSRNKGGGTAGRAEPDASPFVVGAGNDNSEETFND
jgi:hypothetical protein